MVVWLATTRRRPTATRRPTASAGCAVPSNPGSGVIACARKRSARAARTRSSSTIANTDTTELERGYTGQRGQDEQNRRARKAAVQTPGAGLTRSEMSLGGGLTTQSF